MLARNGEGIQTEKIPLINFIKEHSQIIDLGSGVNTPYRGFFEKRNPSYVYYVDIRWKNNEKHEGFELVKGDAFEVLKEIKCDYIWASEFLEHIEPNRQKELMELIEKSSLHYIITFPTVDHFNFHNDPDHRPVIIPHWRYSNGKGDWEGLITNVPEVLNYMSKNKLEYIAKPKLVISNARKNMGLGL